jgi:hypothetical protein
LGVHDQDRALSLLAGDVTNVAYGFLGTGISFLGTSLDWWIWLVVLRR